MPHPGPYKNCTVWLGNAQYNSFWFSCMYSFKNFGFGESVLDKFMAAIRTVNKTSLAVGDMPWPASCWGPRGILAACWGPLTDSRWKQHAGAKLTPYADTAGPS